MNQQVNIGSTVKIRDCGFDEYWLQDQIFDNPSILQLGDLEGVSKERRQSSGGKLDILLKDPEENSMYEVEVMLGQTDESHIIRAIEYWDIEKRRWPQRQHYCVIVAESVTRRFFNVIHLLSSSIPIIAIQANIVESEGKKILTFTKVLDVYEEPDDNTSNDDEKYDEAYWTKKASKAVDAAKSIFDFAKKVFKDSTIGYVKNYISIGFQDYNRLWVRARSGDSVLVNFIVDSAYHTEIQAALEKLGVQPVIKSNEIKFKTTPAVIKSSETEFLIIFEKLKDK
ncbi:MAG: hypothetical protein CAK85_02915 [Spartobacteria bacterium AMD-G5]|nr:MAG: hypothetical protein CAK85_02915 [Spartobacteria bacterium AMD-G5]